MTDAYDKVTEFNHKCPACDSTINVVNVRAFCEIPIRENGWAVMVTQRNSRDAGFSCPKCGIMPLDWVFKMMSKEKAIDMMEKWGYSPTTAKQPKKRETQEA